MRLPDASNRPQTGEYVAHPLLAVVSFGIPDERRVPVAPSFGASRPLFRLVFGLHLVEGQIDAFPATLIKDEETSYK